MNLDFPYHFDRRGHTAAVSRDEHIKDMIELLMLTNPGERVNRPEFGSGLWQLVHAPNSPELAAALQFNAQAALQTWLGDLIELVAFDVTSIDNRLEIVVRYYVRGEAQSPGKEPQTVSVQRDL
jgi:uncharacterized protein